jgi:photosystem II stability/assembly factor-like uncharacterized protein
MVEKMIFMTVSENGITRAEADHLGDWTTEKLQPERSISCLAADPMDEAQIYAGCRNGDILRSQDSGRTWKISGTIPIGVKAITCSPHVPGTLLASGKPISFYRSEDQGESWVELPALRDTKKWWWFSPADPPDWRPYVQEITLSHSDPQVIHVGVEFGAVMRSTDAGESWSGHLRGTIRDCHSLKAHPHNGDWLYQAGGYGGGASFSRDGGFSWQKAGQGLKKHYGISCGPDSNNPEIWYIATAPGPGNAYSENPTAYLYRRGLEGNWVPIGWEPHPLSETPTILVPSPSQAGRLFVGLKNGDIWHSGDYGDTWNQLPINLGAIWHSLIILEPASWPG